MQVAGLERAVGLVLPHPAPPIAIPADGCQSELSRAVRLALWGYKPAQPVTKVCDADVLAVCPAAGQKSDMFSLGGCAVLWGQG